MSLSPRAIGPFRYSLIDSEPFYETRMSLLLLADTSEQTRRKPTRVVLKVARLKEEQFSLANERAINNEERWLRKLQHPGIIKLRPIAEEGKRRAGQEIYRARSTLPGNPWFVVTDYLPGGTLQALVQERQKLNVRLALEIAHALTDTLVYIHAHNCVHQDFKPRNVLFVEKPQTTITEPSRPILIDFGIAGQEGEQQPISGTRPWLPPESDRAHRTGDKLPAAPSMDIYALGVVLYFMLTGKRPPEAAPNIAARLRIQRDDLLDLPNRTQDGMLKSINHLIAACVQDDPTKRPSARQVKQAIEQLLPLLQPAHRRWLPRLARWQVGALLGAVLLLLLFFYQFWGADSDPGGALPVNGVTTPAPAAPTHTAIPTVASAPATPMDVTPTVIVTSTATVTATNTPILTLTATSGVTPTPLPTTLPTMTATTTATATVMATTNPTSTLAPTATPTETPTPRPPTFTPTPQPATPASSG